ncbi:MAG TPA: CGNR zinc finger domain-containing protein [Mycobacterium sp.]|uniref:CGNR zinc finger domain-containing protein n=1 Tax=Mycobacterium sp. TaxID=1785 RepID=UPI002C4323FC|nr:CGNR zinc finger domain-containing protein [Mycobacterium sp.]HME77156.1 CGNR zinc finger domain-containing protein [Mycobacterium sp.]
MKQQSKLGPSVGRASQSRDPGSLCPATERYGFRPAPGGLALVREFLNTRTSAQHGPDLLGDGARAQSWAAHVAPAWSALRGTNISPPTLTNHDAARLRDLRDTLDGLLTGHVVGQRHVVGAVELALDDRGDICTMPTGHGWRWFSSAIWSEVLLSQHAGTWQRLKQCRNPACRSTFYDRSWNNSAVWDNARTCGPQMTNQGANLLGI